MQSSTTTHTNILSCISSSVCVAQQHKLYKPLRAAVDVQLYNHNWNLVEQHLLMSSTCSQSLITHALYMPSRALHTKQTITQAVTFFYTPFLQENYTSSRGLEPKQTRTQGPLSRDATPHSQLPAKQQCQQHAGTACITPSLQQALQDDPASRTQGLQS